MNSIFVGNLPYTATESELKKRFERFGRVGSVRIMMEPGTTRSRGFAFVHMPLIDDAEEAIKCLSGADMDGRSLTVNESKDSNRKSGASAGAARATARTDALAMFDAMLAD